MLHSECSHDSRGKFVEEKHSTLGFPKCRARIVFESGRSIRGIRNRRQDVGRLPVPLWLPEALFHPGRAVAHVLVIAAPTRIAGFRDVNEAFFFPFKISVVIDSQQVPEIVESRFLKITEAMCEHLEV